MFFSNINLEYSSQALFFFNSIQGFFGNTNTFVILLRIYLEGQYYLEGQ